MVTDVDFLAKAVFLGRRVRKSCFFWQATHQAAVAPGPVTGLLLSLLDSAAGEHPCGPGPGEHPGEHPGRRSARRAPPPARHRRALRQAARLTGSPPLPALRRAPWRNPAATSCGMNNRSTKIYLLAYRPKRYTAPNRHRREGLWPRGPTWFGYAPQGPPARLSRRPFARPAGAASATGSRPPSSSPTSIPIDIRGTRRAFYRRAARAARA